MFTQATLRTTLAGIDQRTWLHKCIYEDANAQAHLVHPCSWLARQSPKFVGIVQGSGMHDAGDSSKQTWRAFEQQQLRAAVQKTNPSEACSHEADATASNRSLLKEEL